MVTVDQVADGLRRLKGVRVVALLTEQDKVRVLEVEDEANRKVLLGLGRGDNRGLREALGRGVSLVLITDVEFEWPKGPGVLLMWGGELLGRDVDDPVELEMFRCRKDVVVSGNFVFFRDKMPSGRGLAAEPPVVVFPSKPFPWLEGEFGVRDAVMGFPCPLSDVFLKRLFDVSVEDRSLGTAIVGFNF